MTLDHDQAEHVAHVEAALPEAQPAQPAAKRPKAATNYDVERNIAYINKPGHEPMAFACGDIPMSTRMALAGTQICAVLVGSKDGAVAALERLKAGVYGRKPAAPKLPKPPRPLNQRRQAIANAMVAATKKTPTPLTQQQDEDKARAMEAAEVDELMEDEGVIRQLGKITGKVGLLAKVPAPPSEPAVALAAE